MSLDQNLFTLNVASRSDDPNVLDLVDPNGVVHYTKRRLPGTTYTIELIGTSYAFQLCRKEPHELWYLQTHFRRVYLPQ